jgi:aminoglycoside N3'-acetyltransferase
MERREISQREVVEQLRSLGVAEGGVLLLHTAFRAVRPIEGGPLGLLAALRAALGPSGTLVLPSWTGDDDTPFDTASTPCAEDLGALADIFWRQPGVLRSPHAFAFAAAGPRAPEITEGPLPIPPHAPDSPVGRVHDFGGQVLLIGAGHDANTTLHLAEALAGVPYRLPFHITVQRGGIPARIDYTAAECCCARFTLADDWLRAAALQSEGNVGHAPARLFRSQDLLGIALEKLAADPLLFLHPKGTGCEECDTAWGSVGEGGNVISGDS